VATCFPNGWMPLAKTANLRCTECINDTTGGGGGGVMAFAVDPGLVARDGDLSCNFFLGSRKGLSS